MSGRVRHHPNRSGLVLLRGGLDARAVREDADWAEFASRIGWQNAARSGEAPTLADDYEDKLAARIFGSIGVELHSESAFADAMNLVAAIPPLDAPRSPRMAPAKRRFSVGKTVALALTIASVAAAAALSARASFGSSHDTFVTREADVAREADVTLPTQPVDAPKARVPDPTDAVKHSRDLSDQPKPKAPLPEARKAPEPHPGLIAQRQDSEIELARHLTVDDVSHRWADNSWAALDKGNHQSIALAPRAVGSSTSSGHVSFHQHASFVPAVAFSSSVSMVPHVSLSSPVSLASAAAPPSADPANTLSATPIHAVRSDRVASWAVPSVGQRWVGVSASPRTDSVPGSVGFMAQVDFARALRL